MLNKYICLRVVFLLYCPSLLWGNPSLEKIFSAIYERAEWGRNAKGEGYSGIGSLKETSMPYIDFLQQFLADHNITSVIDVGCGDWEIAKHIDWSGIQYVGCDVVPSLIEKNKELYASENIQFLSMDILKDAIPPADLLICKDVLMHLSNNNIKKFLSKTSSFKFVILNNDYKEKVKNKDIRDGAFRSLSLLDPPFNIKPVYYFSYSNPVYPKMIKQVIVVVNEN